MGFIQLCFTLLLVLLVFFSMKIQIKLAEDVSSQSCFGNSLPFTKELVHGVRREYCSNMPALLFTFHRPQGHLHNISLASVGLWWVGGPAQWRIWQVKCEIKQQMRPCSLLVVEKLVRDHKRGWGSCDCHILGIQTEKISISMIFFFFEAIYYTQPQRIEIS